MLVWINGPFGGGKTQTAHEIRRRLAGSIICDPELLGFGLHRMMPAALRGDFQDLAAWRHGVFEVLDLTLKGSAGPVIVPMTVVEPRYFRETVGRLRDQGHDVRHFALLAQRSTTLRRLRERGLGHAVQLIAGNGAALHVERFAVSRLDLCLERLQAPEFAEQVWTDHLTIAQAADHVAASAGLSLTPNRDNRLRGRLRRAGIGARQIHFVKSGIRL
ncbi:MAG: AAA family ATPase [Solirubrobacteraceae bacterium]